MNDQSENFARDGAAFQKIWVDTMSRMMKAAFPLTPESVPPEVLRQIRSGIFQALTESWNEFLRSPQFQEGMKQWMDRAIAMRKMTNDLLGKARKEMQVPSRDDVDAIALAVRHLETKILSRVEELARQVDALKPQSGSTPTPKAAKAAASQAGSAKNPSARAPRRARKKKL